MKSGQWNYEVFWKETLHQMQERISEQEYLMWFRNLEYRSSEESQITVGVPSSFYKDQVRQRYLGTLEEILRELSGQKIRVNLDVRPVEATRLLQGYQFLTGRSVNAHMNPLRALDADLIARPFLTGTLNLSTYCLGARLLGRFGADRLGLGMPLAIFATLVEGLEASATGYPFERYPGAFPG